jgi:hypothetical protein
MGYWLPSTSLTMTVSKLSSELSRACPSLRHLPRIAPSAGAFLEAALLGVKQLDLVGGEV